MVCYKFPSSKSVNRYGVLFWSLLLSLILSIIFFSEYFSTYQFDMIFLALMWGSSFASLSLLQMYALQHVDTGTLFPITSTLSLVITLVFGFFAFEHDMGILQLCGVVFAVLAVFLLLYKKGRLEHSRHVIGIGLTIICLSAGNKFIQKIVADGVDIRVFQIYQYFFAAFFALLVFLVSEKSFKINKLFERKQIYFGSLIGILGFFGGYALLIALTKGPFALVFSVHSSYIFVVALAGYIFFQEYLSFRKVVALLLAVLSILLIRLG